MEKNGCRYRMTEQSGLEKFSCLLSHGSRVPLDDSVETAHLSEWFCSGGIERRKPGVIEPDDLYRISFRLRVERRQGPVHRRRHESDNHIQTWIGSQRLFGHLLFMRSVERPDVLLHDANAGIILREKLLEGARPSHNPQNVRIDAQEGNRTMALEQQVSALSGKPPSLFVVVQDVGEIAPGGNRQR